MFKYLFVFICVLFVSFLVLVQVMVCDLGDFEFKLVISLICSMVQGLVILGSFGSFYGGFDLSYESGWYIGNWIFNFDFGKFIEIDFYVGFKCLLNNCLGYEMGLICYSCLEQLVNDVVEFYGGLLIFGSWFGVVLSSDLGCNDIILFVDFGVNLLFGFDVILKYGNYCLDNLMSFSGGGYVSVFNDWLVNFLWFWLGIDLNLFYSGISLIGSDCSVYLGYNSYCDIIFMLKVLCLFF